MEINRLKFRSEVAAVAIGAAGGIVTLVAVLSPIHAQTASAAPSPTPQPMQLRPRDLPPSGGGPFASQPNYVATALTLRHWRQPEVMFHVTPAASGDTRTPEQDRALVAQGLALWKDKIGKKLTLQLTDNVDAADIEVGFVPAGSLTGGRMGETNISFADPENDIQRGTIQIVQGLSPEALVQAVAHESGHALGIQGHSDDKDDLMYPYAHLPAAISDRDVTTFNVAYYQIDTSKKTRGFKRGQKFSSAKSY